MREASSSSSEYDSDEEDSEGSEDALSIPIKDLAKRFDLPIKSVERVRKIFLDHDDDGSGVHSEQNMGLCCCC